MADDLGEALDSIEHPADLGDKAWLLTVYVPAATTLAAAVRGRVCDKCAHQRHEEGWRICSWLTLTCGTVGNTCGAWAAKEQA